jgi:hypothetical protein
MQKSLFAIIAVTVLSGTGAIAQPYPFGDQPYRLNWAYDPKLASGCLKWNWQEYQWNDFCPVYVYPKTYMHPRSAHVVFPTKDWWDQQR